MLLCTKDRADKVIDGTADKLTLAQIKKNLLDQIIVFKITNIHCEDYMSKGAWEPL